MTVLMVLAVIHSQLVSLAAASLDIWISSVYLGAVGLDGVVDVDEDEEDGDQQGHAPRDDLGIHEETKKVKLLISIMNRRRILIIYYSVQYGS